jgi:hypothetical protein
MKPISQQRNVIVQIRGTQHAKKTKTDCVLLRTELLGENSNLNNNGKKAQIRILKKKNKNKNKKQKTIMVLKNRNFKS